MQAPRGVGDGPAAVAASERLRPDVVIVDLNLPSMSGLEACQQIKHSAPHIQVVIASAAADKAMQRKAFRFGACAFVQKHFATDDLPSAIQRAFTGPS
jgi:DNA-binding NarL/FixJ family response regulator